MKDRRDMTTHSNDVVGWIRRMGECVGVDLVDFNSPQHVGKDTNLDVVKKELIDAGLKAGAICLRYPKSMIRGALTNPDPALRRQAVDLTKDACRIATSLGCDEVVVWSAYDGYDYSVGAEYGTLWDWMVEGFREVCDEFENVKVSLEYKPTDENTRFFIVPSTGAALKLCSDVDRPNFGLTLDFGHCLMSGESPAQSATMVAREGKLFGVQLNDGYSRLAAEDGMMFGTVHPIMALEFVMVLREYNYSGHIYFDTFPHNEDPVLEASRNVRVFKRMWSWAVEAERRGIKEARRRMDVMEVLKILDLVMYGKDEGE